MLIFPTKLHHSFGAVKIFLPIKHCRVSPTLLSSVLSVSGGNSSIETKSRHWQLTDWQEQDLHPHIFFYQTGSPSQPAWPQVSTTNTIAGTHLILSKCRFMLIFSFNFYMLAETDGTGFSCNYCESRITAPKSASEWKRYNANMQTQGNRLETKIQKYNLT